MSHVLTFDDALAAGPSAAGGKGWNLARLTHFGFRVPRGCVITVEVYWEFLRTNALSSELSLITPWTAEEAASEAAAEQLSALRHRIQDALLPADLLSLVRGVLTAAGIEPDRGLAVRSSAVSEDSGAASFAGIHKSYLNVVGDEAVAAAIKGCYASLWTPAAVSYRRRLGIPDSAAATAIVVQELIQAIYSGVAFSADPVTGRRDRVVINAAFGLGESVVSGSVEADDYQIHIDHTGPVKLVGGHIGLKHQAVRPRWDGGTVIEELGYAERSEPVLQKPQLEELTRVVRRIQDTLGDFVLPQDVEWCHDGFYLYITQARPITALPEATFAALAGQPVIWSNANLKDAMPGVQSPLGWWFNSLTVEVLLRQIFWQGGYDFPEGLNWSRLFHGRVYMNLSAVQWAARDAFGWDPAQTNRALGGHQPEINAEPRPPVWSRVGRARFRRLVRMGRVLFRSGRRAHKDFRSVWDWCRQFESTPFAERYHELEFLHRLWDVERQRRAFLPVTMIHNVGGLWAAQLAELLERFLPGRGEALTSSLLSGADGIVSAQQGYRLLAIAARAATEPVANAYFRSEPFNPEPYRLVLAETQTLALLERFLDEFGHRGVYEMELMNPRWSEDPAFLLETVRSYLLDGLPAQDPAAAARARRLAAEAEAARALQFRPSYLLYRVLLRKAREAMRLREGAKSALVRLVRPARMAALAIGRRFVARGVLKQADDVFFLTGDEIASLLSAQWDGTGLAAVLAHRRERRELLQAETAPDVILGDKAARVRAQVTVKADGTMMGIGVSSGEASGAARLIRDPGAGSLLRKGEILVAPSTDPAWTPLFLRAGGVVMEVGGYLSHGAIVAREYGIPAVVNVAGAMAQFRDGQSLRVDGDTGTVGPA